MSFGGSNTPASNEYTFAADGSYRQSRAVTSSVSSDRSTADVSGTNGSGGRWQLAGWVLILTDGWGQTLWGVAFSFETDEKTRRVVRFYYNNVAYKRQ